MKATALTVILVALAFCWQIAGCSAQAEEIEEVDAGDTAGTDPLIGAWRCESSRPQSPADRPLIVSCYPGGVGFIVSGTDVSALEPFGQRSGLVFEWTLLDATSDQIAYVFNLDELLYDDSGLVSGRFPVRVSADLLLNDQDQALDDELGGVFRFYITQLIYDTDSGTPEAGAAIIGEEVLAADPTGAGGSRFDCIRLGADPVFADLDEGSEEVSVPLMDLVGGE